MEETVNSHVEDSPTQMVRSVVLLAKVTSTPVFSAVNGVAVVGSNVKEGEEG